MDKLKDHIDKSREEFELFPFDTETSWNQISEKIESKRSWPRWKFVSVAACFALVVLGAVYQLNPAGQSELSEVERYYESEIDYKVSLVRSQLNDPTILEDLENMDRAFAELKSDLQEDVDNEEVVLAMMQNYQLKLQILEEILLALEKEKSEKSL